MAQNVSIDEAARLLGVSQDTIRRRIRNEELQAQQEPRPQGYTWRVTLPDDEPEPKSTGHVSSDGTSHELLEALKDTVRRQDEAISQLREQLGVKDSQLQAREREVQELHVLVQQAQALPAPRENRQSWWRFWQK